MLPDITVLGPWTYLATEVAFGSAAAALLWRAGALRRAGRTVLAIYPVAYVWDWYTLEVGVFAIPMRTGVELLGIPVEEHLFIVVVTSLIVGVHETLHGPGRDRPSPAAGEAGPGAATTREATNGEADPGRTSADGGPPPGDVPDPETGRGPGGERDPASVGGDRGDERTTSAGRERRDRR